MRISEASSISGLSAKSIRHYEAMGLLPKAPRRDNGYRDYSGDDVATLRFIARARGLGFSLPETKTLVSLWRDRRRPARAVKQIADGHIRTLEERICGLEEMVSLLRKLAGACRGNERPDCAILDALAELTDETSGRPC